MQGLLRDDLLAGRELLAAPRTDAVAACERLGAHVRAVEADLLDEAAVEAAVGPCGALIVDARALLAGGLRAALDSTWCVMRATANAAFIPQERGPSPLLRGGKVVLVAPAPGAGEHAEALRAGLENLARTTSVEWSQYGITTTAVRPGPSAGPEEVAEVVAYLVSPAGDYFSGCALDLQ